MADIIARLEDKARKEIRYARGMRCMHRERYLESCHELKLARQRGDLGRAAEIADDLRAFVAEMQTLIVRQQAAYDRLLHLHKGEGFVQPQPPTAPDQLGAS
jgi:hypothetical protein